MGNTPSGSDCKSKVTEGIRKGGRIWDTRANEITEGAKKENIIHCMSLQFI